MKLYNTETRKKEEITGKQIKMYACGPTVYDRAHIGNLRTYVNIDILKRALRYLGHDVKHVMNITDIEDKIINKSLESGVACEAITGRCEEMFWKDLDSLNVSRPDAAPHATDEKVIAEMVKIIDKLVMDGHAYVANDGSIYFDVEKWPTYGKLSHLDKKGIKAGARVSQDEYDKENPQDFALWKATKAGEPSWEGPQGILGRPGWHIECSAMSMLYLGETIDIHAGGVDLVFPHHENEIAQSEAYTGKPFVKNWFHGEHLMVEGKKMSKSSGNLYSIDDLSDKFSVEPLAFRMLCLQSNYDERLNFTAKSIKDAQNTLNNLRNFIGRLSQSSGNQSVGAIIKKAETNFDKALQDNLNTAKAMAAIFQLITEINKLEEPKAKEALSFISKIDNFLGLSLSPEKADAAVKKLFDDYLKAKEAKDWDKSDELRTKIAALGWVAEDTKCDSILRKK